jgi:hypothetical protein
MRIATSYDNCTTEIEHYKKALEDGEYDQIKATQNALEASVLAGELAKSYNLDAKAIERYADSLEASGNYQTANIKSLT